jgi:hypothetical protein
VHPGIQEVRCFAAVINSLQAAAVIIIIIIIYLNCDEFLPSDSGTTVRHNTQIHILHEIIHHAQIKHSTQRYANNIGHIIHNEYSEHYRAMGKISRELFEHSFISKFPVLCPLQS